MSRLYRLFAPTLTVLLLIMSTACATAMSPVHPTRDREAGPPVSGVRFDGEQVVFREPAMPVASGNIWKREVANYTATTLNALVDAEETAPAARTAVTFEMHGPSVIQIGSWKEMTVSITTRLPDGRLVRSAPESAYLDSNLEYAAQQALTFGGPILDIAAFVAGIYFIFAQGSLVPSAGSTLPMYCACIVGLGLAGLSLNAAQAGLQYLFASFEEQRWSDLYLRALEKHADDIRAELARPVVPGSSPETVPPPADVGAPLDTAPPPDQIPPPPPPPIGDPADDGGGPGAPPFVAFSY